MPRQATFVVSPSGTSATRVERARQHVVGQPRLVDGPRFGDSVWADHAELIACRVLQDACRPLAGLRDRKRSRASSDHLGDHRRGVFDKQVEVRSGLRGLRLGNPLEGDVWRSVCAVGPVDRDVRPASTVRTSRVAEELLPECCQLIGVRAVDGESDLHPWPRGCVRWVGR